MSDPVEITASGTDAAIVEAVRQTLAAAVIDNEAVFAKVAVTTSERQARAGLFTDSPLAVVRYEATAEHALTDRRRGKVVSLVLTLAAKADTETARLGEAARLVNAAKNAVNSSPPAQAQGFAAGEELHRRIQWDTPRIDATRSSPWAIVTLGLRVAYTITDETSH